MNDARMQAATPVDTVIVGAGIAGVAVAARLQQGGGGDFVVLERADDVGGTWRDNTYPGVASDIPSHLYSFSFRPNPDWTRRFSSGPEIQDYLRRVVREEGLAPRVRLRTDVTAMTWHDGEQRWLLSTSRGDYRCRVLVLAAGRLSEPIRPEVPGLAGFTGPVMHSSAWDPAVDLSGARVAVVGTGASAVQLVPQVALTAGRTTVFQRSAPYVVPRSDAPIPPALREGYAADASALRSHRDALFREAEAGHAARVTAGPERDALRARALDHLAEQVTDPVLRQRLTPDYEIGCKRILLSDDYFPTFASGSADLEPSALVALDDGHAVADSGRRSPLDVLVFATGFAATRPPFAKRVRGRAGRLLSAHWSTGMSAYATILVAGFPNLMVINGPNAALGHNSAFVMIEAQAELAIALIDRMAGESVDVLEVTDEEEEAWTAGVDAAAAGSVWLSGCRSWYLDDSSGRLTLLWPGTTTDFRSSLRAVAQRPLPGKRRR